jgi:hypothetical protein
VDGKRVEEFASCFALFWFEVNFVAVFERLDGDCRRSLGYCHSSL